MQLLFSLKEVFDASDRAKEVGSFIGQIDSLGLVALSQFLHHLDVLLSQEVVGRIGTLADGFGNQFDGFGLGFSLADTCLCLTLSLEDRLFLSSLSLIDDGGLLTL